MRGDTRKRRETRGERERSERRERRPHSKNPRMKLKTFSCVKKQRKSKTINKYTIQKADHRLFGHMILIATIRNLNMQEELKHPLVPWSANSDRTVKHQQCCFGQRAAKEGDPAKRVSP